VTCFNQSAVTLVTDKLKGQFISNWKLGMHLIYTTPLLLGESWTKQSDRELNWRARLLVFGTSTQ